MKHLKFNTFLLTLLLSMAGITASAHDIAVANEDGKTIYYVWIYDNTKLAVSYQGDYGTHYSNEYSGNVVIPESVTYNGATYPVTSIGSSAFYDCPGLTSVTIPNSVTSIGSGAFDGTAWYNNQPDGLVYAGKVAYKYKGTMPANTSISLQEGTLGIAGSAFNNCSGLTSMTIPSSVTNIDIFAFENCPNLTNIIIDSDNTIYDSRNNCNAIIETISNTLIVGCKNTTIPNSVTSIGDYAFYSCSGLTSLTIPNSVTSIGNSALWCCSGLTSVTIPNSVTSIGISAFWGCSALTSVTIPNSVRTINRETFYNCSNLTTVKIGNSVTSIGPFAFYNCSSLTSLNIPDSVTSIGDQAFSGTALFDNISDGVFYIGKWVFGYKGTLPTNLSLEEGTIGIIPYAFDGYDNQLSVTLPNSMSAIGDHSFTRCSGLESITIPSSITSIGVGAFSYCTSLTSVDFPNTINSIGASAFIGCASLTSVTLPSSVTSIEASTFLGCANLTSVTIPNSVTNVGFRAFLDCINLTSVTFPGSVTSIGSSAFQNCSSLTSVTLPGSVTSIGSSAFQDCSSLTSVTLPGSVTSFGNSAFSGCYDLTNIKVQVNDYSYFCNNVLIGWFKYDIGKSFVLIDDEGIEIKEFIIPEDVTSIGDYAFSGCSGLTSVIIGNSVTSIGDYAFTRCSGLTSVTIPNSVTSIGQYAFNGCSGLTSVTIPNSVTSIADYAFRNCTGLNTITIGSGVTSIGTQAFANIPDLTDVYCYAESVPTADSNAFENSYITGVVLHVPAASVDLYKKTGFWKTFKDIVPIVETPSEKCTTPTIAFANGKLTFECETEDVEYVYSFSSDAFRTSSGSDIPLAGVLHVSVYATKDGCADSDVATIDINLSDVLGDANGDGEITIADITTLINTILGNDNAAGARAKM